MYSELLKFSIEFSSITTMESSEMDKKQEDEEESEEKKQRVSYSAACSSTPSSSFSSSFISLQVKQEDKHEEDHDEAGYQTPTSPRHRIPTTLKCPPPPKKPPTTLRAKRKPRRVLPHHQIKVFFIQELVNIEPRRKKARAHITFG
ncbi:Homeobox-like domain-containing protein [Dioscorea alata]|uniref:Homeobox-like domain-containing protein n=1 Tax=Dioscorea alata TaxID=55571 RepID=A0ACB7U9J1_DIOAL|nr:Homeobox-like domain-containing protein [Dioscorea alata]